ncbi:MAG: hypothetical protein LKI85_09230 [Enterobacter sp.]|jgi:hypothetical protein|nr:hypothetical protein [Enterobacter sp.]
MSTNKQAQAIISDIKLKHGSGDVYAPIIRWDEFRSITGALEAAEKRIDELSAPDGNAIAWESTTPVYVKFITDERYQKLRPGYQKWYKPYRCSNCEAGITVKGDSE